MHYIDDAVVKGGKLTLSNLPFEDGKRVQIMIAATDAQPPKTASIHEIRQLLKGGVERFDEPFDPMIPLEHWEMLK